MKFFFPENATNRRTTDVWVTIQITPAPAGMNLHFEGKDAPLPASALLLQEHRGTNLEWFDGHWRERYVLAEQPFSTRVIAGVLDEDGEIGPPAEFASNFASATHNNVSFEPRGAVAIPPARPRHVRPGYHPR